MISLALLPAAGFLDRGAFPTTHLVGAIYSELGDRCAVSLELYSKSDVRIAKAERDTFILDRIEAGITLYRA